MYECWCASLRVQVVAPAGANVPAGHSEHEGTVQWPDNRKLWLAVDKVAERAGVRRAGVLVQVRLSPVPDVVCPAVHAHVDAPGTLVEPAGQVLHVLALPVEYCPAAQSECKDKMVWKG